MKPNWNYLVWVLVVILSSQSMLAAERYALIIGNEKYKGAAALRNPANDAALMSRSLQRLEFHVTTETDLDLAQLEDAIVKFSRRLTKGSAALVYFAGHGLQVNDTNYLVPVDARLREEFEVRRQCLELGYVLDALEHSESNLNVVIMDCCRDNPYKRSWQVARSRSLNSQTRGLAKIDAPEGTVVAFSTAPGRTAADGHNNNSPYTLQLTKSFDTRPKSGLKLRDALFSASRAVKRETGQVPWLNMDATIDEFYLWRGDQSEIRPQPLPPVRSKFAGREAGERRSLAGLDFVWCPAGSFVMGSPATEPGRRSDEGPVRTRISQGFWMATFEVSQFEYLTIAKRSPSRVARPSDRTNPVDSVSWNDAADFCKKLDVHLRRQGDLPDDWLVTLPSEAQWEYACRAGTTTATHYGDSLNSEQANFFGKHPYNQATPGPDLGRTSPVGRYKPNAWGLHDMHGNVSEWCRDGYQERLPGGDNPEVASANTHIVRGGSWADRGERCRSAYRARHIATYREAMIGFRVVLQAKSN